MKRQLLFLVLVIPVLYGCKIREKAVVNTVVLKDSTEIVSLQREISERDKLLAIYLKERQLLTEENSRLQSERSYTFELYDTDKPGNPLKEKTSVQSKETGETGKKESDLTITLLKNERDFYKIHHDSLLRQLGFSEIKESEAKTDREVKDRLVVWWVWVVIGAISALSGRKLIVGKW